jgi:hypothetical protein
VQDVLHQIARWSSAGEPLALIVLGALVALCFVVFNALRVVLYLPQIVTCWKDEHGCSTINLVTWSSWIVANTSTGLYMWLFHRDGWGLSLNLSNALMCAITVAITLAKRAKQANGQRPPAAEAGWPPRPCTDVTSPSSVPGGAPASPRWD